MTVSFAEFVEMLDLSYEIPEYMKSFIKDMESNKRYCVCLHKHYGKNTLIKIYRKYCKKYIVGDKK